MAPRHVSVPKPAPKSTSTKVASVPKVIHQVAQNDATLSQPKIIPPTPVKSTAVATAPSPTPSTTTAPMSTPPALTGPSTPGGGTDSGSPKGDIEGSGTGDHGNGNGIGPGEGPGTGEGKGPFGIDAGPGEGPRHIVYVVDESGSMDSRIDTTRSELDDALSTLSTDETFNMIAFSTDVRVFDEGTMDRGSRANVDQAKQWLGYQRPDGGTNLQRALQSALGMPGVNVVVLITDGVPTYGETNFGKIARNIRRSNRNHARIYTIGLIGKNPDGTDDTFEATKLLQQLALDSGGTSKFVSLGVSTPE